MVSANGVINNKVGASISGVTNTFTVTNPSNTASSAARETITVGGGTAADPTLNFNVSGSTNWEMGIDNSVNDNLTISQGTALGTNDTWRMTTAGQRTLPLQSSFFAYLSADQNNVTGNGTEYQIIFNTENFDRNSNYNNATGVFTAPVDGIYMFSGDLAILTIGAAHTDGRVFLTANGQKYLVGDNSPAAVRNSLNGTCYTFSLLINLLAGQTSFVSIIVSNGTKTVTVEGPTLTYIGTYFSGFLVC